MSEVGEGAADPRAHSDGAAPQPLEEVRHLLTDATAALLGTTIALSDEQWRQPSRLPGWSRGHVASHLARQADGTLRLIEWALTGRAAEMYASAAQRDADIDAGSGRRGLDLQIDLDTTAGRLTEGFERVDHAGRWDAVIELRGGTQAAARLLPLGRLCEVVLHHVDLDAGYGVGDIEPPVADWLLEWCAFRLRDRPEFPSVALRTESGAVVHVGRAAAVREVVGPSPAVLGWLTGRSGPEMITGADGLALPAF